MKKTMGFLLALVLLGVCLAAAAEGNNSDLTPVLNTARVTAYAPDDPCLAGVAEDTGDGMWVVVLPVRKNLQLQFLATSGAGYSRQMTLTAADPEILQCRGGGITGLKAGETVLTAASVHDETAKSQYRVVVVNPVTRINVTAAATKLAVGETAELAAEILPADAAMKALKWTSSDEGTATVDENGNVTGAKRGYVKITATAKDGSGVRGSVNLQVIQNPTEISLSKTEITVNTGRNATLRPTVLPANANDKNVVWSSSDESVAKVNLQGMVTGVNPGTCEITCASRNTEGVQAKATVHVQRPVERIVFEKDPAVYVGETGKVTWSIQPADATNQAVKLISVNERIVKVSEDGTITGVAPGTAYIRAVSTDGSNRQGEVKVRVLQHVESVEMKRDTAYIDVGEVAKASAVIKPEKATNRNMTWESADTSVATVAGMSKEPNKVKITGIREGETTITGTTEDGGLQTTLHVSVGHWSRAAKITSAEINGKGWILVKVKNASKSMTIGNIKIQIEAFYSNGKPAPINTKNGSNVITGVYSRQVYPGGSTPEDKWKLQEYDPNVGFQWMTVRVTEYQINGDWVKVLRSYLQPVYKYTPGK